MSPCGFFGRVSTRVFNRSNRNADCCGPVVGSDVPIEYGTSSSAVVQPAIPSYPSSSGGTTASPPGSDNPDVLDVIPKAKIGPPGSGGPSGANNSSSKTSYQTRRSVPASGLARYRNESVARTMASTSEPTSRSARAASTRKEVAPAANGADDQDPLDHLPPLDLPGEVTRSSAPPTPAAPASPGPEPKSTDLPKNKPLASREPSGSATPPEPIVAPTPVAEPSPSASVGPGLTRFVAVDLKLAGGAAPSVAGLQWLVEKGYRTLLDLREPSEVPSTFITEVTNRGLRYVALPMSLKTIDRNHVDRFDFEIAEGEARPLFFFDSDGTRAGALWYIRRILVDHVDPQIGRREAEELGLLDKTAWLAATDYVANLTARQTRSSAVETPSPSVTPPEPSPNATAAQEPSNGVSEVTRSDPLESSHSEPKSANLATGTGAASLASFSASPTIATNADTQPSQAAPSSEPPSPSDPLAWRPFAAMVITGLSVPLAYWSRSIIPTIVTNTLASLPAPARRPKSLPGESGG